MEEGGQPLERYFQVAAEAGREPGNWRFNLEYTFEGVDFSGKTMLDIGAGNGLCSFYAACAGASRVVSLEPEAAGSSSGMRDAFADMASSLALDNVRLVPGTLQDYDDDGETFDVVLLYSSINHLDEEACIRLQLDAEARERYAEIFSKLAALTRPGGTLIASDCSSQNVFARLGRKNPFAPTIEWHKHQPPAVWASLLETAGFEHPRIRWSSFNTLRSPGRVVLGNRVAAYLLHSEFVLTMRRS